MRDKLFYIVIITLMIAAFVIPPVLVLNSVFANTTAILKPVTIEDMWVTEHTRSNGSTMIGSVRISHGTSRYQVYHVTVTDGEQQFNTTITGMAFKHLNIGDSVYATVHYNNESNKIMEVIVLSEEQYEREMERLNNGEIEVLSNQ